MKILKITFLVITVLAVIVIAFLAYAGMFTKIAVVEKEMGGFVVAGKDVTGPYMNVGPAMCSVDSTLKANGVMCTRGFGIYYDNPNSVAPEKCRSFVGNILDTADSATLIKIKAAGLRIDSVAKKMSVVIDYPSPNNMSYMIGPMKAYPALNKYITEKKIAPVLSLEIYDVPAKKTYYVMQY